MPHGNYKAFFSATNYYDCPLSLFFLSNIANMETETLPLRKLCKDCKYSQEEMEQILQFKESFVKSRTASACLLIMKSKILPAMFTYWQGSGKEPRDAEEGKAWAKVIKVGKKGYPTNVQRRPRPVLDLTHFALSLAKRFHAKLIRQVVKEQYKEMGITSISFIAYTHPDGCMVIDIVDHIANIMGVLIKPFIEAFPDEVKSMKLHFMNYMKLLLKKKENPLLPLTLGTSTISVKLMLETTAKGYPIIPISIPSTSIVNDPGLDCQTGSWETGYLWFREAG
ncbi:hypothetical protein CPB84DRAFT_1757268 [Gymnopilus junonius]|uniref:Uncharacterized protein n=1 Tax=Gymnopilus junonius TaxID=109634 RepID=A0A9P5N7D6_GYMJU|nr:hypothetical protein CPB84DRAFT_1757268 [Gymnopilus junonius]